jgi:hypothetical protein
MQEEDVKQSQPAQSPPQQAEPDVATDNVAQSLIEEVQEATTSGQVMDDTAKGAKVEKVMEAQEDTVPGPKAMTQEDITEQSATAELSAEGTNKGAQADQDAESSATAVPGAEVVHQPEVTLEVSVGIERIKSVDAEVEVSTPSVEVTSEPEPKTLATERPSDVSTTPAMSRTPSRRESRSQSKSPMRIEESIEALDALEEALENVGKAVSHYDQSHDEKSPRKNAFPRGASTPSARTKTPRKTPVVTRVSKVPSAAPKSIKPTTSSLARASSVRAAPPKDLRTGSTDTVDYLASKRRPVSVSFPTPPPPPKGRAPTKPTFQLSSDAVAAKLKAQKEERQKREAEREAEGLPLKPRPISMPPVAKSTKAPTKATFVLPGEAVAAKLKAQKEKRQKREVESAQGEQPKARPVSISIPPPTVKSTKPPTKATFVLPGEAVAAKLRAQKEERQKREEEAESAQGEQPKARPVSISMPPPTVKSTKPPTKATFVLSGEAVAAKLRAQKEERQKREEEAEATKPASKPRQSIARKPVALPTRGISIPPPPPKSEPQRSTSLASTRTSIYSASTSSVKPPVDQKLKGREVFNRDKMEAGSKERERKEKEEAAKQARAQAAERGRIASREWAERQRKKVEGAVRERAEAA